MWTRHRDPSQRLRDFDREMLRTQFASLLWAAIQERKRIGRFTLQELATRIGVGKSQVSKWFSGKSHNWQLDTIADMAHALDLDFEIRARERTTGTIFTASGVAHETMVTIAKSTTETESWPVLTSNGSRPPTATATR